MYSYVFACVYIAVSIRRGGTAGGRNRRPGNRGRAPAIPTLVFDPTPVAGAFSLPPSLPPFHPYVCPSVFSLWAGAVPIPGSFCWNIVPLIRHFPGRLVYRSAWSLCSYRGVTSPCNRCFRPIFLTPATFLRASPLLSAPFLRPRRRSSLSRCLRYRNLPIYFLLSLLLSLFLSTLLNLGR